MIAVAMATGGDTRQWFDRTVAAEVDYAAGLRRPGVVLAAALGRQP